MTPYKFKRWIFTIADFFKPPRTVLPAGRFLLIEGCLRFRQNATFVSSRSRGHGEGVRISLRLRRRQRCSLRVCLPLAGQRFGRAQRRSRDYLASLDKGKIAALAAYAKEQKFDFYKLGDAACDAAAELRQEIDTGLIAEEGETSPPHLAKFSQEFLNAIPGLFNYERIYIVSPAMLPIEMVRKDGIFVGDRIAVSHEFDLPDHGLRGDSSAPRPLASYVVEAVDSDGCRTAPYRARYCRGGARSRKRLSRDTRLQ